MPNIGDVPINNIFILSLGMAPYVVSKLLAGLQIGTP